MDMLHSRILISGASIAGPALACLLRHHHDVTVVERAPRPRPGGQAVDLRGAGRSVVEAMGLMDRVREVTLHQKGLAYVRADGSLAATMPVGDFGGEGLVSEIEVLRGDLGQLMYDASLPETRYIFDDTIVELDQDDDGVTVTFENSPTERFDLVVGADGLHSTVRRLAFGPESDYVHPLHCYTAWFTAPQAFDLDNWYLCHNAPGGLVSTVRPGRRPDESKVGLYFRSQPISYDRHNLAEQRALVAERFNDVGWLTPQLISAMHSADDFFLDSMGQVKMDRWSQGRVALIGDAASCPTPLTGLGTSLALVGAYVLAGELCGSDDDHQSAFARMEEIVRPYVTQGQELPPTGVAGFAPRSRAAIAFRDASMRWMRRWPVRPFLEKQFSKAGAITLPVYDVLARP